MRWQWLRTIAVWPLVVALSVLVSSCGDAPSRAQGRLFAGYTLEFLDEYRLPAESFAGAPVGGLSAISFDPRQGRYYALSDDRARRGPARFYTLAIALTPEGKFARVALESATTLKTAAGEPFRPGTIDPEGISIAPGETLYISSEGVPSVGVAPFIARFDRASGQLLQELPLPPRYLPADATATADSPPRGVGENLGFEALTLSNPGRTAPESDPYRVFAATEGAIAADELPPEADAPVRLRLLHYLVGPVGMPVVVAEHAYLLEPPPLGSIRYGLSELLAVPPAGHFLALERSYGLNGFGAKLFEAAIANATDISRVESLGSADLGRLVPIQKQLVLDFAKLDIIPDNLEGMTLGPRLADGSQTLLLVSDNNFGQQPTQLLLFRLSEA